MKFHTIEITGIKRVVFKSCRRKNGEDVEHTTIWNRIFTEDYDGKEEIDDYVYDYIWVDEERDRVRADNDMIDLLKDLQYSNRYRLWVHNESVNIEQL